MGDNSEFDEEPCFYCNRTPRGTREVTVLDEDHLLAPAWAIWCTKCIKTHGIEWLEAEWYAFLIDVHAEHLVQEIETSA